MATEFGGGCLCSLPAQGDCLFTAGLHLSPSPLLGLLTEPPLRGLTQLLLPGLLSHILSLGSSRRLVTLKQDQSYVTGATFLAHTHHLLVHSQLRPERPPQVLSPMALPGHPLPSCLVLLSHIPLRVTRSSHHPGQAVCCVLGRPLWCQVEETRGTCGASHTEHSGQHPPTDRFTLDGPRVGSGAPLCVLVLVSLQRCLHGTH